MSNDDRALGFHDTIAALADRDLGAPGRPPPREHVVDVQRRLAAALRDPDFVLDCLELDLQSLLAGWKPFRRRPAFHVDRVRGFECRIFFWPPGTVAPVHEHTAWTVTAVLQNALEVTTYDVDVARTEQRLARKNVFQAEAGRVGHIYEHGIHSPANPTSTLSSSIHLFSWHEAPSIIECVGPIEGLFGGPLVIDLEPEQVRRRDLSCFAVTLARFRSPRAVRMLHAIFDHGDRDVRDRARKAIARLDADAARRLPE